MRRGREKEEEEKMMVVVMMMMMLTMIAHVTAVLQGAHGDSPPPLPNQADREDVLGET